MDRRRCLRAYARRRLPDPSRDREGAVFGGREDRFLTGAVLKRVLLTHVLKPSGRRRGVALILVLIAVTISATLALAFVSAQSTSIGIARNIQNHPQARLVAESGLELAIAYVRANTNWRTAQSEGAWVTDEPFASGTFTVVGEDGEDIDGDGIVDGDGDLADDADDPLTIIVTGKVNNTTHVVRAVVKPLALAGDLLLVMGDPASPTGGDLAKTSLLESWGWQVTLLDDDAPQVDYDSAVATNDVAFVSESVSSAAVGTKMLASTNGVVLEIVDLGDEFGLTQTQDTASNRKNLDVIDVTHYITSPLSLGNHDLFSSNQTMHRQSQSIAPGATVLGNHTVGSKPSLYLLDTGDELYGGGTAAGRRVQLPWGEGVDYAALTSDGRTLMQRACEWAAQGDDGGSVSFGNETEYSSEQDSVADIQIATPVTLTQDVTVTSICAFVKAATPKKLRCAIYTDDAGEPGTLVAETAAEAVGLNSYHWHAIAINAPTLTARTYWLALAFEHANTYYKYASGGQMRYKNNDAVGGGFVASWGGSDLSLSRTLSLYAVGTVSGGGGAGTSGGYTFPVTWQEQP